MPKRFYKRPIPYVTIKGIRLSIASDDDISRMSAADINAKLNPIEPAPGSSEDTALGGRPSYLCSFCGDDHPTCPGHHGRTTLKYPVILPIAKNTVIMYAKVICLECGAFMLGDRRIKNVERHKLLAAYVGLTRNKKKKHHLSNKNVKVNMICPSNTCGAKHPHIYEDKDMVKSSDLRMVLRQVLYDDDGTERTSILWNHKLLESFRRVSDETVAILGYPLTSHPRHLITYSAICPAITLRPTKRISSSRTSHDDLTELYKPVIEINNTLPDNIPTIIPIDLGDRYMKLNNAYYNLHMSSMDENTSNRQQIVSKSKQGIANRFPGKKGRVRGNLMGSRCFNMGRSVISGDPRLTLDQIGVPLFMCRILYKEMTVTYENYEECMTYYKNGTHTYPGCRGVIKKSTNNFHDVNKNKIKILPGPGDKILRDVVDGDIMVFGRQPTLWDLSLRMHRVKVIFGNDSLRINPLVCYPYNADFDGDECNATCNAKQICNVELETFCDIATTGTKTQDGGAVFGMFQNSLLSISRVTRSNIKMRREMIMLCTSYVPERVHLEDGKEFYTGRDLVSTIIPEKINYEQTAFMYNPEYPIDYKEEDVNVVIVNGRLVSGILDKSSIGQGKTGTLLHTITNCMGARQMTTTAYAMQQLGDAFMDIYGGTIHLSDLMVPEDVENTLSDMTNTVIHKAIDFHEQFMNDTVIVPIAMTRKEYYETQIMEILGSVDDRLNIILRNIDVDNNNLFHMIFLCGKGSKKNMISIMSSVGQQIIDGNRICCYKSRSMPYFPAYSSDPRAWGFISNPLTKGLSVTDNIAMAMTTRVNLIHRQLSTATTGAHNRSANRNMESLITNAYGSVLRDKRDIVQVLYGGSGTDTQRNIYVKIKHVDMSDQDFNDNFSSVQDASPSDEVFVNREFERLKQDREFIRNSYLNMESQYMTPNLMDTKIMIPFDLRSIILMVKNRTDLIGSESQKITFNMANAVEMVEEFCSELAYVFTNRFAKERKDALPFYYHEAVVPSCIAIRSYLCTKQMTIRGITNNMLEIILRRTYVAYKTALLGPGVAVGLRASMSLNEMYTQFMLDAHLRVGVSGSKGMNKLRGIELMTVKDTDSMKNPTMLVRLAREIEENKEEAERIAHNIEMIPFRDFVKDNGCILIGEKLGKTTHSALSDQPEIYEQAKSMKMFDARQTMSNWTIRYNLDMNQIIRRYISIFEIVDSLQKIIGDYGVILGSPEISETPSITIYLYESLFVDSRRPDEKVIKISDKILNVIVRGVDKIKSASVVEFPETFVDEDGSLSIRTTYAISTMGSNIKEMLLIEEVDGTRTLSNSTVEMYEFFGITSAYRNLITEMMGSFSGPATAHYLMFASEMTSTGIVTGITKKGASSRNNNFMTIAAYSMVIQTISAAAMGGDSTDLNSLSSALMTGSVVNGIGSTYGDVIVDSDKIQELSSDVMNFL